MTSLNPITTGQIGEATTRYVQGLARIFRGFVDRTNPDLTEKRFYVLARNVRQKMEQLMRELIQNPNSMAELMQDPSRIEKFLERKIREGELEGDPQALLDMISLNQQFSPEETTEIHQTFSTQEECIAPAIWQAMQAIKQEER